MYMYICGDICIYMSLDETFGRAPKIGGPFTTSATLDSPQPRSTIHASSGRSDYIRTYVRTYVRTDGQPTGGSASRRPRLSQASRNVINIRV